MELSRKRNVEKEMGRMEKYVKETLAMGKRGRSSMSVGGRGNRKSTVVTEGGKKFRSVFLISPPLCHGQWVMEVEGWRDIGRSMGLVIDTLGTSVA